MARVQLQKLQTINNLREDLAKLEKKLSSLNSELEGLDGVLEKELEEFSEQIAKQYKNTANMVALEEDLQNYNEQEQEQLHVIKASIASVVDNCLEHSLGELVGKIVKKHKGKVVAGKVAAKVLPKDIEVSIDKTLSDTDLRVVTDARDFILDIPLLHNLLIQKVIQQSVS